MATACSSAASDPFNAVAYTLSFHVDAENEAVNSAESPRDMQNFMSSHPDLDRRTSLGFLDGSDVDSGTFADSSHKTPVVQLNVTLVSVKPATTSAAKIASSVFELHRIRSALLVLLQQVNTWSKHVHLISASVLPLDAGSGDFDSRLLFVYNVDTKEESQRRGIEALLLSRRMRSTIEECTQHRFQVHDRRVDFRADGLISFWDFKLPGIALILPASAETVTASLSPNAVAAATTVRRSQSTIAGDSARCRLSIVSVAGHLLSLSATVVCICAAIQWESNFPNDTLFLHQVESNFTLEPPSVASPTAQLLSVSGVGMTTKVAVGSATALSAPWIVSSGNNLSPWLIYVNSTSLPALTSELHLRFVLEFVSPESPDEATSAFTLGVRLRSPHAPDDSNADELATRVVKSSVLPLIAAADGSTWSSSSSSLAWDPFVTATPTVDSNGVMRSAGLVVRVHKQALGGVLTPEQDASLTTAQCTTCMTKTEACTKSLECRAISACIRSVVNIDPAIYASLSARECGSGNTTSSTCALPEVLEQCLSGDGGDGSMPLWSPAA